MFLLCTDFCGDDRNLTVNPYKHPSPSLSKGSSSSSFSLFFYWLTSSRQNKQVYAAYWLFQRWDKSLIYCFTSSERAPLFHQLQKYTLSMRLCEACWLQKTQNRVRCQRCHKCNSEPLGMGGGVRVVRRLSLKTSSSRLPRNVFALLWLRGSCWLSWQLGKERRQDSELGGVHGDFMLWEHADSSPCRRSFCTKTSIAS